MSGLTIVRLRSDFFGIYNDSPKRKVIFKGRRFLNSTVKPHALVSYFLCQHWSDYGNISYKCLADFDNLGYEVRL